MKRKFALIFLQVLVIFGSSSFSARAQERAIWVRPFIGALEDTRKDSAKGREFIRAELQKIKRAKLNTIYLEAFWDGYTIYPSKFASQRPLNINYGVADERGKGWDVLQVYVEEAAKLDIKIHAWLHVFHQWNTNLGGLEKSPIFSKHADWAMLDAKGAPLVVSEAEGANRDIFKVFMSPSNGEVRKYLREIVGEISKNYPRLGGIQWDYIRYPLQTPESPFDYSPLTLAAFQKETSLDAKKLDAKQTPKEWRVWQDWKSWAKEGYVDALLPMLYSRDFNRVELWAKAFRADVSPKTKIYPALFIGHFYDAKEKTFDARYLDLQTKYKFDGFGLFAAQSLTDDLIERLEVISHEQTRKDTKK